MYKSFDFKKPIPSHLQKHDDFLNIITTAHKGNKPERDVHYEEGFGTDFEKRRKQKRFTYQAD